MATSIPAATPAFPAGASAAHAELEVLDGVGPVAQVQRLDIVDVVRGVALLGILLLNIPFFAMPDRFSEAWRADTGSVNFWVFAVNSVLFEGKMRALFSAVFGAGIVLFTTGKERAGRSATGLFYKRMAWLTVFGLLHAHLLLWLGDILYFYGLVGMLAYLFRKAPPRYLAMGVPLVAILGFVSGVFFWQDMRGKRLAFKAAAAAQASGATLTPAQDSALAAWRAVEQQFIPNPQDSARTTTLMKGRYADVASHIRPKAFEFQTKYLLFSLWDALALMLLGIALFKWGFLTGQWSTAQYARTALIGYGVGLSAVLYSLVTNVRTMPTTEAMLAYVETHAINWTGALYDVQRIALMMAHVAVIMLLHHAGWLQGLMARLRAVGQLAFTNYIMQTMICSLVFFGYGLNQFAEWEYWQLYLLVGAIWALQLLVSPWWLQRVQFGPLEWAWRSLTYGRRQPLRRRSVAGG